MRIRVLGEGPMYQGTIRVLVEQGHALVGSDNEPHDLLLLAGYSKLLPVRVFAQARIGALCFHPSLLPRHRGRDAVYWTVRMGDTETGATWFWPDAGIDTGPIAIQGTMLSAMDIRSIRPRDIYEHHLVPLGLDLLRQLLPRLAAGERPAWAQDETQATYEPPRR